LNTPNKDISIANRRALTMRNKVMDEYRNKAKSCLDSYSENPYTGLCFVNATIQQELQNSLDTSNRDEKTHRSYSQSPKFANNQGNPNTHQFFHPNGHSLVYHQNAEQKVSERYNTMKGIKTGRILDTSNSPGTLTRSGSFVNQTPRQQLPKVKKVLLHKYKQGIKIKQNDSVHTSSTNSLSQLSPNFDGNDKFFLSHSPPLKKPPKMHLQSDSRKKTLSDKKDISTITENLNKDMHLPYIFVESNKVALDSPQSKDITQSIKYRSKEMCTLEPKFIEPEDLLTKMVYTERYNGQPKSRAKSHMRKIKEVTKYQREKDFKEYVENRKQQAYISSKNIDLDVKLSLPGLIRMEMKLPEIYGLTKRFHIQKRGNN